MFIGYEQNAKFNYYRVGTRIPCPPEAREGELCRFGWMSLLNTGLDISVGLSEESFVGSVTLMLGEGSRIAGAEVLLGDRPVGKYMAETGRDVGGRISIGVGVMARELTVRIYTALFDLILEDIEIAVAKEDGAPLVWPTPKSASFGEGYVDLGDIVAEGGEDAEAAKAFLLERYRERFGKCPEGEAKLLIKLDTGDAYAGERLTVEVAKSGITLTAGCRLSLMRAVCILLSVGEGGSFRVCQIDDKPDKEMRGFHMGLPKRENIEFAKRLFKYVLLPLGYNQLFVQFCGGMRYESHPEISEGWLRGNEEAKAGKAPTFPHDYMGAEGTLLEKREVADMLGFARELGFEIIPEVQSLGHVQYITYAHPELAERVEEDKDVTDTRAEDMRPSDYYSHCYCPSDERCYELIFDLIDEIIEVAKPRRYVHIGHDEVYHLGVCKRCRSTPKHILFARDVIKMHDRLSSLGYKTMMWADMLQPVTLTEHATPEAAPMLPKDILQLEFIWYFDFDQNTEENLYPYGYEVMAGNLYSSHFPRYRRRMRGMVGGQVSTWCAVNEYRMGKKGKLWDLTYTAELLANPESYDPNMREVYTYVISKLIQPIQRDEIRGKFSPFGYAEVDIKLPAGESERIPSALKAHRASAVMADGVTVKVGGRYDRLKIEHATLHVAPRHPWQELYVCGEYTVRYSDGTEESFAAEYAGNVYALGARYGEPLPEQYHRHTGYIGTWFSDLTLWEKDGRGEDLTLTAFIWENPHPEKEIEKITYSSREGDFAEVILTSVKGLSRA